MRSRAKHQKGRRDRTTVGVPVAIGLCLLGTGVVLACSSGNVTYDFTYTFRCTGGPCEEFTSACTAGPAAASYAPVLYGLGAVVERVTDASVPGAPMGWSHTRTYNSRQTAEQGYQLPCLAGDKWEVSMLRNFIAQKNVIGSQDLDIVWYVDASTARVFENDGQGGYSAPGDVRATCVHSGDYFTITLTDRNDVYTFYDFSAWDSKQQGLLYQLKDAYGNTTTWTYSTNETGGRIIQVTTSQDWTVNYSYVQAGWYGGGLGGRIYAFTVMRPLPGGGQETVANVAYTYNYSNAGYSADVGSTGDLVGVSATTYGPGTTRYRQYRYTSGHRLKMVLEPQDVDRILKLNPTWNANTILTMDDTYDVDPEAGAEHFLMLKDCASRSFTYYTSDQATSSINTPWVENEDLEDKYGGANVDESGEDQASYYVKTETVRAACGGCGGDGTSGVTFTYAYMKLAKQDPTAADVTSIVVEDLSDVDGTAKRRRVIGLNQDGHLLREAIIENPTPETLKCWCKSMVPGTEGNVLNQPLERRMPSAHTLIDTDDEIALFLDPTTGNNDTNTLNASTGVIYKYRYNANGRCIDETVKKGRDAAVEYMLASTVYIDAQDARSRLPEATYRYPAKVVYPPNHQVDGVKTVYEYSFYQTGGNDDYTRIMTRLVNHPKVPDTENGAGVGGPQTVTCQYYDEAGRLRWEKDGEGRVTYSSYHPERGGLAYRRVDMDTDDDDALDEIKDDDDGKRVAWTGAAPAGFTYTGADARQIVSKYEYDNQGRQTRAEEAAGTDEAVVTYTVYKDGETRVYPAWDGTAHKPLLPVQVGKMDKAGRVTEQYAVAPTDVEDFEDPPDGTETLSDRAAWVAWTKHHYDDRGRLDWVDRYRVIPAGDGDPLTNYYRTSYGYDTLGRKDHVVELVGEVAGGDFPVEQVTRTEFDVLGRAVATWRGVSDEDHDIDPEDPATDPTTLEQVSAVFYDGASAGDSGVGDGLVTSRYAYYDADNAANNVQTVYHYNWRGQLRGIQPEDGPYTVRDVDNLGRVTAVAQFTSAAGFTTTDPWDDVLGDDDYAATIATDRGTLSLTHYDVLGRVYQTERCGVNWDDGTLTGKAVVTNNFYDRNDRLVAAVTTGRAATEFAYDGVGRQTQVRIVKALQATKYDGNGAFQYCSPAPQVGFDDLEGEDGGVIVMTHQDYDAAGNVTAAHTLEVVHDEPTGEGGITIGLDIDDHDDFVQTTVYSWYDGAGRVTAGADYGAGTDPWAYAAVPERPEEPPASGSTVLVTSYAYNAAGRLLSVTDPASTVTEFSYDALGRKLYVVENYQNFNFATEGGTGGGDNADEDRVTRYTYNGLSRVTELAALDANGDGNLGDNQVTTYTYADDHDASLVTKIKYPDGNDTTDNVQIAYWLDGAVYTRTDQRGTALTYDYDAAFHRMTGQRVTAPGGADPTILAVAYAFDDLGRTTSVTSHGNTAYTDPRNGVAYEYNELGMLAKEYQDHAGAAGEGDPYVEYGYDDVDSTEDGVYDKAMRLKSVRYPNARVVHYLYADAGDEPGLGDAVSRLTAIASDTSRGEDDANVYAAYAYNGTGRIVQVAHPGVTGGLNLTYGSGGTYAGLDRFGRVVDQKWQNSTPTVLDQFKYGYDQASNRLWRDVGPDMAVPPTGKDEFYTYDGLQRLQKAERGTLAGSPYSSISNHTLRQDFGLDALGNWAAFKNDAGPGGENPGDWDLYQTREHNVVNETTGITGGSWVVPAHDAAGNMTRAPRPGQEGTAAQGLLCVYDAWNRLVAVWQDDGDGTLETEGDDTLLAEYRYDGLARRIAKLIPNGNNWDRTDNYYSQGWQVLEERAETVASETAVADDVKVQYVWDIRYIDAPVCRDENKNADGDCTDVGEETDPDEHLYYTNDANMNVTALVERKSGSVAERYVYDPYGSLQRDESGDPLVYSADWSTTVTWPNSKKNEILYCGYRFDPETGLYHVRYRYYHPTLGRWMARDPIRYRGAPNLFAYCDASPAKGRDPLGLATWSDSGFWKVMWGDRVAQENITRHMTYTVSFDWGCHGYNAWASGYTVTGNLEGQLDSFGMSVFVVGVTTTHFVKEEDGQEAENCPAGQVGTKLNIDLTVRWMMRVSLGFNPGLGPLSFDLGLSIGGEEEQAHSTYKCVVDCCCDPKAPTANLSGKVKCDKVLSHIRDWYPSREHAPGWPTDEPMELPPKIGFYALPDEPAAQE